VHRHHVLGDRRDELAHRRCARVVEPSRRRSQPGAIRVARSDRQLRRGVDLLGRSELHDLRCRQLDIGQLQAVRQVVTERSGTGVAEQRRIEVHFVHQLDRLQIDARRRKLVMAR